MYVSRLLPKCATIRRAPSVSMRFGRKLRNWAGAKRRSASSIGIWEYPVPIHRAHLAHRNIRYQRLEVRAARRMGTGYSQIPIEDADRRFAPAQFRSFLPKRILTLGALLMVAHLGKSRLTYINVSRFGLLLV